MLEMIKVMGLLHTKGSWNSKDCWWVMRRPLDQERELGGQLWMGFPRWLSGEEYAC